MKDLSQKGIERLLLLYNENNIKGNNIFPPHFATLVKYGYASNDYIDREFIRTVTRKGIEYLKQNGLIE
jgi:hypothetical protein